ncbi:MFS transporter [Vulgatibacter incomptus]|uniref:MFS transporter n=1 Tax=Vulgatibacter incomptus TaxID=1391653 RepID=A0A0K1PI62_9BACT|nr:MFS transporter [Vulgatibacter incomptus]AKU93205.1 MFS transporter [Vulgatibacter incomptus]
MFGSGRAALCIGVVMSVSLVAFEAMSVATIMPVASNYLGGLGGYGWAFSAFMLANVVGTIATGQAADARGPSAPFAAGLVVAAAGLLVAGLATSWPMFVVGRALQGLGGGAVMTTGYLTVRLGFPERLRARVLALISSAWVVPALVGPAVAGVLADRWSWRYVFVGLVPLLLAAAALMLPSLRKLGGATGARLDPHVLVRAVQLAAGVGLLLAGLQGRGWHGAALLIAGIGLAVAAARHLLPSGTLLAAPGLPAGLLTRGLLCFCYFGAEAFLPLGLTSLRGLSPGGAGLALSAAACTWFGGTWLSARLDAMFGSEGRRLRVIGGFLVTAIGVIGMAAGVLTSTLPIAAVMAFWALGALGMGLVYPTLSVIVLGLAPAGQEGRASSSLNFAENVGIAMGAGFASAAVDWTHALGWSQHGSIGVAYLVVIVPGLLGIVTAFRVFRAPSLVRAA